MFCSLPLTDFREYGQLDSTQRLHVQTLLMDYYKLAWHEIAKEFPHPSDCPYTPLEMMAQDLHELELNDEFEVCRLIKDTIDNSEYILNRKLRRNH